MGVVGTTRAGPALPQALHGLLSATAYPHPVAGVELIETQLSWVLLTGERAYKLKRPVRYPFVDQRRLEDRRRLCDEELRLNQRFAPQLYLQVCAITAADGSARIGGAGPPIEYAVVMRSFDRREQLDQLVLNRRLGEAEIEEFGAWLAHVHRQLPAWTLAQAPGQPAAIATATARNAEQCVEAGAVFATGARIRRVADDLAREVERRKAALAWRAEAGFIRECHADLHLSNLVRLDGVLRPFDCLEFDPALRWIDTAQDVAFLHADLQGYEEPRPAARFLNAYLEESGDYHASLVLPLYIADRALVRAKVLALQAAAIQDRTLPAMELLQQRHQRYLQVAERTLLPRLPRCVMMTGLPGSGKSWLAARLAVELPAVVVRSDRERKRLAGLGALESSNSPLAAGRYSAHQTDLVYERLARCAAETLSGGSDVIVDANFGKRRQRAMLADLCRLLAVPLTAICCEAPEAVLQQRIAARLTAARDPSEANLEVLNLQAREREPIGADEPLQLIHVDTVHEDALASVLERIPPRR